MEINDVDEIFVKNEWIQQNKKYECAKPSAFVTNAKLKYTFYLLY